MSKIELGQLKDFPLMSSSTVDEVSREKLAPYAGLSSEESYQSRELEKVDRLLELEISLHGHVTWH